MKTKPNIGIVIPVYNESKTISKIIDDLNKLKYLKDNFENYKILVVNDGSSDNTSEILKNIDGIETLTHGYNMGVGAAVRNGLKYFESKQYDIVVKIDGDNQHDISEIKNLVEPVLTNQADIVYGDRFSGDIQYKMPKYRVLGNKFFSYVLKKLTGYKINDSQPGFFAGNTRFLKSFYILTNYNYTQQVLYSSYLGGLRFLQVPITFKSRVTGESFVKFSYPFKAILQILLMIVLKKPLLIFGNSGLFFILVALITSINQLIIYLNNNSLKPIQNVNLVLGLGITGIILLITGLLLKAIQNLEESRRN